MNELEEAAEKYLIAVELTKCEERNILNAFIAGAQSSPVEERGWVRVTPESMPYHDQDILFVPFPIGSGVRHGYFLEKDEWERPNMFYGGLGYFEAHKIQYWMPLPESPNK